MSDTPAVSPVPAVTSTVGQQTRRIPQASAAARNADGAEDFKATIWYPVAPTADTVSLNIGPEDAPYMLGDWVALDAPFVDAERRPIILYSHGYHGSAATTSWFGVALAKAGYVVVSVDHPGGNSNDLQTLEGSIMWWERPSDLKAALAAIIADPVIGPHVDAEQVGVCGYSLGGFTALIALGGVFDGARYDAYCIANPESPLAGPPGSHPVFNADNPMLPEAVQAGLKAPMANHALPSVRAGFLFAPVSIGVSAASLQAIEVPVTLIVGSEEVVTPPEAGAAAAHALIPNSTLVIAPGATHSSFVNRVTPAGVVAEYSVDTVLAKAQDIAHALAIESALALFDPILRPRG